MGAVSIIGSIYLLWYDVGHNNSIPIESKSGLWQTRAFITCLARLQIKKMIANGIIDAQTQTYISKFKVGVFDKLLYQEAHTKLALEASGHVIMVDNVFEEDESVGEV